MALPGRKGVLEAVIGPATGTTSNWNDITRENRTDFAENILELERARNAGGGIIVHDLTNHAAGDTSFVIDATAVTRPLFGPGGGRRVSFRWSPEGTGAAKPFTIYQCLISVQKPFEAQGAVTYTVAATIEVEPIEGSH